MLRLITYPDDLVSVTGARCLDGSAGGLYFRPGSGVNASRLVIAIEGGGECRTLSDCNTWRGGSGPSSTNWPTTRAVASFSELSNSAEANPDFFSWAKVFLPYCSADMHSGQRHTPDASLGGYYFAGHNLIAAGVQLLANVSDFREPSHVLVTGSSAGGIGALLHADFFSRTWPRAIVKAAPSCGFFYAGVSSLSDWAANRTTPAQNLGFISEWDPYIDEGCANITGGDMAACTDAHLALPHIRTPLFLRENLFDTAKLANCGLNANGPLVPSQLDYLRTWGGWMRAQLDVLRGPNFSASGFFAPSCLNHGNNLDFATAPPIRGVTLQAALRSWFFGPGPPPRLVDDCGDELPCTQPGGGQCAHVQLDPLSAQCSARLRDDCPGLQGQGAQCDSCVRQHAADLRAHGCPEQGAPVFAWFCDGAQPPKGHHVCDLSV